MKYFNNLCLIILIQAISLNSFAQLRNLNSTQKLFLDNELNGISTSLDRIGTSISVDGNIAAIAAPKSKGHGVVHLFEHNGIDWINKGFVEPSDGFFDDYFGGSISLHDNTLFVGAYHHNYLNKTGAVYVYEFINDTWVEIQKISSPNNVYESHFGISVKQENGWLIIGASGESKVYVYKKLNENWELHQTLEPSLIVFESFFGYGLEIKNDELFIGASAYSDQSENDSGIIYYYRLINDQWQLQDSLLPSDLFNDNLFGIAISLQENRLLIGSPQAFSTVISGTAYVFEYINEEWIEVQKVVPDDPKLDSWFGSSVYLDGDSAIVGAYRDSEIYSEAGAAYLFNLNESTWEQSEKMFSYNPTNNGRFGISVFMGNNKMLTGGYREHGVDSVSGSVSSFIYSDNSWSTPNTLSFHKGAYDRRMGSSVHIFENSAIVGTPYRYSTNQSAVLYYELQANQWIQT